jgi:hypothetical protein
MQTSTVILLVILSYLCLLIILHFILLLSVYIILHATCLDSGDDVISCQRIPAICSAPGMETLFTRSTTYNLRRLVV